MPSLPLHPNCECEFAAYSGAQDSGDLDPELQAIVDEYEAAKESALTRKEIERDEEERMPAGDEPAPYEAPSKAKTAAGKKLRAAQKKRSKG